MQSSTDSQPPVPLTQENKTEEVKKQQPAGNGAKEDEENLLMDFSSMFKRKVPKKMAKPPTTDKQQENKPSAANWLLEIPTKITTTLDDLKQRKVFDQRRWMCISRPQYERSCGISSLVSVWNYLFSKIGCGVLNPITAEEGLTLLGVVEKGEDFSAIDYGDFTGNLTLINWFHRLCKHFQVKGSAKVIVKLSGEGKTETTVQQSRQMLMQGLKSETKGYIYHAYDHYFCPVGYQLTPNKPLDAYKRIEEIDLSDTQMWLIIGETSKNHPVFHVKKWKDVQLDLETEWPNFYNIRDIGKGIQRRPNATPENESQKRGTTHCIIQFEKNII